MTTHSINYDFSAQSVPRMESTHDLAEKIRSAARRCPLFRCSDDWQRSLQALTPKQMRGLVEEICQEEDSAEAMEKIAALIPLERLQEVVRLRYPDHIDALQDAASMLNTAKQYLDVRSHAYQTPTLKTRIMQILEALLSVLDSLCKSLGLAEFFKPAESEIHSDIKAQKVMMILSLFTMLTSLLLPVLGASLVSWVIGGVLLALSAIGLIFPYIKPPSKHLPKGENWTQLFREGKLSVVGGRKRYADEIARILGANQKIKTHPMLIGQSGAGKTEAVKAFVKSVERGDYPELKGKQVIYFNTASLVQHQEKFGGGNQILARILEEMGRHKNKYILVFDEIHYALKEKENSALGEELKTMLDPGNSSFPYVIGITTQEEYYRDIYVHHAAFARRFKPIQIDNPRSDETLEILSHTLLQQAPQSIVHPGALNYLLTKTGEIYPNSPQPLTALKILMKCIQATAESQPSTLELRAQAIRSQIESIGAQAAVLSPFENSALNTEIRPLEESLRFLELNIAQEKRRLAHLFKSRDELTKAKEKAMKKVVALAGARFDSLSRKQRREAAAFLLLNYFQIPRQEKGVLREAKQAGVQAVIDPPLVDRMIDKELENDKKIQEARLRGRQDLEARIN